METSSSSDTPEVINSCKKRRTIGEIELQLKLAQNNTREAKFKLIQTARENAKLKVLLSKYMEADEMLISSSQLSTSNETPSASQTAVSISVKESADSNTTFDATKSTNESLSSQSKEKAIDLFDCGRDQSSQQSQWSDINNTSHLEDIINFLEKQDIEDSIRSNHEPTPYSQNACVRVGVAILLTSPQHSGCVLIGRRLGSHGEGKLALPGGHLEMYESWEECAIREVKEETDVTLERAEFLFVTNDSMEPEGRHYVTIFMHASINCDSQAIRNMEPHKCESWYWESWSKLEDSENLFTPLYHLIRDPACKKQVQKRLHLLIGH